jgi:hypothetical protein
VIVRPPVPDGNRLLKLGMRPVSALALSTLPGWARRMYGRPSGPLSEAAATAGLLAARLMFSQQRLFSGAMRAVDRAESAGETLAPAEISPIRLAAPPYRAARQPAGQRDSPM